MIKGKITFIFENSINKAENEWRKEEGERGDDKSQPFHNHFPSRP
jgi:hypothetical protein